MTQRLEWLKSRMDTLFSLTERPDAKDLGTVFQSSREFKNPVIYEKLVETLDIDQYGSNFSKTQYDPNKWLPSQNKQKR